MKAAFAPILRQELRARIPAGFRNQTGRPLLMIVHATRGYDRSSSVEYAVNKTVSRLLTEVNLLEIEERKSPSYLNLPAELKTSLEYAGGLLSRAFFAEHAALIEGTDAFIFVGGRANRCLTNAFLSVLLAKVTPLERLFADRDSIINVQGELASLLDRGRTSKGGALNFHFNSDAIYPSHFDFRFVSKSEEYLNWSPNIPFAVTNALGAKHQRLLAASGLDLVSYVDGQPLAAASGSGRRVNLFYWHRLDQLDEHIGKRVPRANEPDGNPSVR